MVLAMMCKEGMGFATINNFFALFLLLHFQSGMHVWTLITHNQAYKYIHIKIGNFINTSYGCFKIEYQ